MCNETKNLKDTNSETRGSKFAIAISREFPIPGIPDPGNSRPESREWNFSLSFPFPKMGMEFFTLIPVPENGNGVLWNFHSRSRKWEWNLPFHVPVPEVQKSFPLMAGPEDRSWVPKIKVRSQR